MPQYKVSPKLQHLIQQKEEEPADWRKDAARQQAAVVYVEPEKLQEENDEAGLEALEGLDTAFVGDEPEARLNVYFDLNHAPDQESFVVDLEDGGKVEVASKGGVGFASVTESQLEQMVELPQVAAVDLAEAIKKPIDLSADVSEDFVGIQKRSVAHEEHHKQGEGVLIGIIDVEGFDFAHEEFIDEKGGTRFVRIWDQGNEGPRPGPQLRGSTKDGSEFKKKELDYAIKLSKKLGIAPYHIEAQSATVIGSHGTHVASIAAGNSGVCPKSDIAAVLIHLPQEDQDRRTTFTDSTRILDAIEYLLKIQEDEGYKAISINISLGTNGHAHDGTSSACRWIDTQLSQQGRVVCIAAGNAGQEEPQEVGDLGFIVGRIHTSGSLPAQGLTKDIKVEVAGYPIDDVSENEIELWYSAQDRIAVKVRPPHNGQWTEIVKPGKDLKKHRARDSAKEELETIVEIYSELYRPKNGSNRISIFLKPARTVKSTSPARVEPGIWTIRLYATEIRDGTYDGWIERDDPVPVQGLSSQSLWHYPCFFAGESNVDRSSISTLASSRSAITVGNIDDVAERVAVSSSQGPTRDGRHKPEIVAPGTQIVAANGFHPLKTWTAMTGTSMASPYVAGVAALMLAINPTLTPAQILGIMIHSAQPLPGADYAWRDDAGYGQIIPDRCIEEVIELV